MRACKDREAIAGKPEDVCGGNVEAHVFRFQEGVGCDADFGLVASEFPDGNATRKKERGERPDS